MEDQIKEFEALDCYKTLKKLKTGSKVKGFVDPKARFNLDKETLVGTMHARNEEKRRLQKMQLEETSPSDKKEENSHGDEVETGEEEEKEVVSINSKDSGDESKEEEEDEEQLPAEERSWNKVDEEDSEGNSLQTESSGKENDREGGWGMMMSSLWTST